MVMDNLFLVAFAFWPGVVLASALLNMLVSWTFSWSELIFDYLIGMAIGLCFYFATQPDAGFPARIFFLMSNGLFALLHWLGLSAFADRTTLFLWSAISMGGATLVTALLDRATLAISRNMTTGGGVLSALICLMKWPFSLLTTAVGLIFWIIGAIAGRISGKGRVGFLGGQLYVEWNTTDPGSSATTLGGTIQTWSGNLAPIIDHELYHSRQYIYMHDWLTPAWVLGGIWGWISSAIAGMFKICYFSTARHDREVGNPLERAAYRISGNSPC